MTKITKERYIKAVVGTGGIMLNIASKLGVTRMAVYNFCHKHPEMMELRRQEEEKILDIAENSLFSQAKNEEQWAVKYLLATKGKRRGYVEKSEVFVEATHNSLTKEQIEETIRRLSK